MGFLIRSAAGLQKTKANIGETLIRCCRSGKVDEETLEELEDALILSGHRGL